MDACDHAKKHGLAQNYIELSNCDNKRLRIAPGENNAEFKKISVGDDAEANMAAAHPRPTGKYRDKYDLAYKQLSDQLDQG